MKFDPSVDVDEGRGEFSLLPKGDYDAVVTSATDKTSKSGNEMIELGVQVFAPDGSERYIWTYLVAIPSMQWKTKRFAESAGLSSKYETGELAAADCEGCNCRVAVDIEKDKSGKFPDKNTIKDFSASTDSAAGRDAESQQPSREDSHKAVPAEDIPF